MRDLSGKTAVITGAASGMGRAFANRFAKAGMNIVMSDIEEPRLDEAVEEVSAHGTGVIGQITDVSESASMDELGERAFAEFDSVHVVCNNAGVGGGRTGSDYVVETDWRWVIDVNLWGVIHGHRVFMPHLLERGEGHVVNTASILGHLPSHSAYVAAKWGVVGITLGLYNEMIAMDTGIGVSCLCPGWVATDLMNSERNRPESTMPSALVEPTAEQEAAFAAVRESVQAGMPAPEVAELVHDAVVNEKFWIFTDMNMVAALQDKHDSITENRNPAPISILDL